MDELENMSTSELNGAIKRQLLNMEILMKDVKDIKFTLIGNEMNNHTGLIKDVHEFKEEFKQYKKDTDERIEKVEHYQTGMRWGTRIVVFIMSSAIVINLTDGVKWLYHTLFE